MEATQTPLRGGAAGRRHERWEADLDGAMEEEKEDYDLGAVSPGAFDMAELDHAVRAVEAGGDRAGEEGGGGNNGSAKEGAGEEEGEDYHDGGLDEVGGGGDEGPFEQEDGFGVGDRAARSWMDEEGGDTTLSDAGGMAMEQEASFGVEATLGENDGQGDIDDGEDWADFDVAGSVGCSDDDVGEASSAPPSVSREGADADAGSCAAHSRIIVRGAALSYTQRIRTQRTRTRNTSTTVFVHPQTRPS